MHYWSYVTWTERGEARAGRITRMVGNDSALVRDSATNKSVLKLLAELTSAPAPPPTPPASLPEPWAASVALMRAAREYGALHAGAVADYPEARRLREELLTRGYLIETPEGDRLTALAEKHL